MPNKFKTPSKEQSAQVIANHMPKGRAWDLNKNVNSTVRKMVRSLSASYNQVEQKIEELHDELDINKTFNLLTDWEKSVLLPDSCLGDIDSIIERRKHVIRRLQRKTNVTIDEFQDIVDEFFTDVIVELVPGVDYYSFEYEFPYPFWGDINDKFILVAKVTNPSTSESFEYEFEYPFHGAPNVEKLRCFIEEFLPSNVYLSIVFI